MSRKGNVGRRLDNRKPEALDFIRGSVCENNDIVLRNSKGIFRIELVIAIDRDVLELAILNLLGQSDPQTIILASWIAVAVN